MSSRTISDETSQGFRTKNALTNDEYLETIKGLTDLMAMVTGEENLLVKTAIAQPKKAAKLFVPSLLGNWFYEQTFHEHIGLLLHYAGLLEHFRELIDSGEFLRLFSMRNQLKHQTG